MQDVLIFLKGMIPTEMQMVWGAGCSVAGGIAGHLLGWNNLVETLLVAMAIDYVTGVLAAYRYKRKHPSSKRGPSSRVGALGIVRKVSILCIVALAHYIDTAMGTSAVHTMIVWFYIGNEGLSIIENAANSGVPVPQKLCDTLEQLKNEKGERGK
ncbi:hypothetical protein TAMA11512_12800 [Selenomonas sp. TAMA-11512]|uniref:phage holin family protein n=1 Tax=Selenomonas sp. TAMA-11512 TaxID=3095337 RepID=UPI003089878E|nr:hypothetical protein TAMA11512_12800 [Selenomonas sp. TAMA-11512]